jgi:hypothetical protein
MIDEWVLVEAKDEKQKANPRKMVLLHLHKPIIITEFLSLFAIAGCRNGNSENEIILKINCL